jgi:hypothetical protein
VMSVEEQATPRLRIAPKPYYPPRKQGIAWKIWRQTAF